MTLVHRMRRIERLAGFDEPMEPLIGEDGKPVCCEHGKPRWLPKGYSIFRVLSHDGEVLHDGLPRCGCQADASSAGAAA